MNYRHAYHAGNFADVLKHAVLTLILETLSTKDAAFGVLDTHAGCGKYDLWQEMAVKTREYTQGIELFLQNPHVLLSKYARLVKNENNKLLRFYPGSPLLTKAWLRPQDRLILAELHPEECAKLKEEIGKDTRIAIHHMDGYQALKAFLPLKERRGLVLIDPPFEKKDEFSTLANKLLATLKRWPTGVYAIWYPLKDEALARPLYDLVLAWPKHLIVEIRMPGAESGLKATGMAVINPPWQLYTQLHEILPGLLPGIEPIRLVHADGPLVKL